MPPNNMRSPLVSILIVHKNGEDILDNCLKSVMKTDYPSFEVLLMLTATTDDSARIAKKYPIKMFSSKKNLGYTGGNNFLIKRAKGKYLVITNDDVEFEKSWLKNLVDFAEKTGADACQPKIRSMNDKASLEYAGACGGYMDRYGYAFCRGRIFNIVEKDEKQYDSERRIFWASGACFLIRSETLKKVGLLDEDFFMYSEEIDLCWRINLAGGKIYSVPSAVVYHLGNYTIKKEKIFSKKEYLVHRNSIVTMMKNYSDKNLRKNLWRRFVMEIVSGILFPRMFIPVIKSLFWVCRNKKMIRNKREEVQKLREVDDEEVQKLMIKRSMAYLHFVKGKNTFREIEPDFY